MTNKLRVFKLLYILPLLSGVGLLVLWNMTSPADAGPVGLLAVFILIYIFWLGVFFLLIHGLGGIGYSLLGHFARRPNSTVARKPLSVTRAYFVSSALAFGPVCAIAIGTFGQLRVWDVVLIVTFTALALFYVLKRA